MSLVFLDHLNEIVSRLDSLSYIQVAILLPGLFQLWINTRKRSVIYLLALFCPLFILSVSASLPSGLQASYIHNRVQIIQEISKQTSQLVDDPIIIAEHGTQFVVSYITGLPAQRQLTLDIKHRNVYWLLLGVPPDRLEQTMIKLSQSKNGTYVVLIRNIELKQYLDTLTSSEIIYLFGANWHLIQTCRAAGFSMPSSECLELQQN